MKVYLSGPMKGYPDSNFPEFHRRAAHLRLLGFDVVNPAEIKIDMEEPPESAHGEWKQFYQMCLRADIRALMDCDGLVLLRGWERSNGSHLELHIAHRVGMEIMLMDELARPTPELEDE